MAGYVNSIMNWITGSGPGEPSSPSGSGEPSSSRSRVKLGLALPDELLMLGQELEQVTIHLGLNTKDLDDSKAAHMTGIMQKYKMWQLCQRQRPPGKATAQDLLRGLEDLEDVPFGTRLPLREGAERFIPQWHKDPEESGIESMSDSDSRSVSSGCESMSEYELSVDRTMLDGDNKTRSAGRDMTDKQLLKVAERLGQEWEQAAIHLDLKTKDLDEIMGEERHLTLRKYKMLQLWKNRRPGKATAQDLLRGLEDMEDLPVETHLFLTGLENNRSKPVKKKPSCSSGQGSRPGELSSSPPLKMPASDGTLVGGSGGIMAPSKSPGRRALIPQGMSIRHLSRGMPRPEEEEDEEADGAPGGVPVAEGAKEDTGTMNLATLYSLLQKTLQNQEHEANKQEQRWRSMQVQLNNVRDELEGERRRGGDGRRPGDDDVRHPVEPPPAATPYPGPAAPPDPAVPSPAAWTGAAVPKLEEGDDIEQYLTTFERLAAAYQCPRAEWAVYLAPFLTGRARAAYAAMDVLEARDYRKVREAILSKYEISEEIYRQRFRDPDVRPGDMPKELYNRLKDIYRKWIKPDSKTAEEIGELLILEQYLCSLAPEVRVWVKEHNPTTGRQAAELAEAFLAARPGAKVFWFQSFNRSPAGDASAEIDEDDEETTQRTSTQAPPLEPLSPLIAFGLRQRPPGKATAKDLLKGLEDLEDVPFGTRLPLREGAEWFIPQWHKDPEESGIESMSDSDRGSVSSGSESMSEYELSVDRTMLDGDNKTRSAGRDMSDEQLLKVAETLGKEWEQAAIHLDLKNEDLDEIMGEERNLTLQKYKMLQLWKNRRPGKATAQDLLRGLEDMEDLPVETCQLLIGLENNRSKPVKKKPSCSSGQGSRPGELSSSPPLKMPASDGTLDDEDVKDDEEEMHFKSHREKCEAAQQSPEYEKVTPRKISKWRFQVQLECEGTYECSVTGLVFEDSDIKAIEEPVNKYRKKCIRIYKPAACRLEEKAYHLTSEPERKIEPLKLEFWMEGFSEAHFAERPPFRFLLKDSDCDEPLWSATINEDDSNGEAFLSKKFQGANIRQRDGGKPQQIPPVVGEGTSVPSSPLHPLEHAQATSSPPVPSSATQSAEGELKRIFCDFIDRVSISLIKSLLDELWQKKMLTTDEKDSVIQNQTNRKDQARCLIHSVMAKGERTSQMMIDCMKKTDPELCITLGLISTPAAGVAEILQTRF